MLFSTISAISQQIRDEQTNITNVFKPPFKRVLEDVVVADISEGFETPEKQRANDRIANLLEDIKEMLDERLPAAHSDINTEESGERPPIAVDPLYYNYVEPLNPHEDSDIVDTDFALWHPWDIIRD